MLCAVPVAVASFFGFEVMSLLLHHRFGALVRFAFGSTFGVIVSAWIYFVCSLYYPLSETHGIVHNSVLLSIGLAIFLFRVFEKETHKNDYDIVFHMLSVVIPSAFVSVFVWNGLLKDGLHVKGSAFGDFPFHMNLISSFMYGCNKNRKALFDLLTPFYAHEKLAYPFIPNFYSAVLISCFGATYHDAVCVPSLVFIYSLFIIFSQLTSKFCSKRRICCFIAPWLFLLIGGLGFTRWFNTKCRNDYLTDYVHHWGDNRDEYWFQTISHILLPQRASLFSLPLAWGVLLILMECNKERNLMAFLAAGLITACLPQVQPHSIIALLEWGASFFLITFPYNKKKKWNVWIFNYLILGTTAFLIGFPQCEPFFNRTQQNFWKIQPLYAVQHEGRNFVTLWWYGLGAFIVLAIFHVPLILNNEQMTFYCSSFVVFLLGNFIWYQPWSLDNTKVFNATFIPFACAGIAFLFSELFVFGYFGYFTSFFLFLFCIASGSMSVARTFQNKSQIWSLYEAPYIVANFVRFNTDPDAVWISDNGHTNPIVVLAGRQNFLGYRGWLSSHGINDSMRLGILSRLQQNPDDTREIDQYNVTYVGIRKNYDEIVFLPNLTIGMWKIIYSSSVFVAYQRTNKSIE